jgi:hypothetical protein
MSPAAAPFLSSQASWLAVEEKMAPVHPLALSSRPAPFQSRAALVVELRQSVEAAR